MTCSTPSAVTASALRVLEYVRGVHAYSSFSVLRETTLKVLARVSQNTAVTMAAEVPIKKACMGVECPNEAGSLQCPTCLKIGKESTFCSQDCFKRSWVGYPVPSLRYMLERVSMLVAYSKLARAQSSPQSWYSSPTSLLVHSKADLLLASGGTLHNPFPSFKFTGSLRPVYPLSPRRPIPAHITKPPWSEDGDPKYKMFGRNKLTILDKAGQDAMRKVCRLSREVLDIIGREVKPGVTTDYLDEICHNACIERNVKFLPSIFSPIID